MLRKKLVVLCLSLALTMACQNPTDPPQTGGGGETGTVRILIDGASAGARTLLPASTDFTRYTASFSGHSTASHADEIIAGGALSVDLSAGSWTIAITASTGTEGLYTEVGRGSTTVAVVYGETVTADIAIAPLVEAGKKGAFSYSVTIPGVHSATLNLTTMGTNTVVNGAPIDLKTAAAAGTASGTLSNLAAGYYLMTIALEQTQGGKTAGRTEVVHLYDGLTTVADYVFADNDFEAWELYFDYGRRRTDKDAAGGSGTYTVPLGRTLVLAPVQWGVSDTAVYEWQVDGITQAGSGEYFSFVPTAQGEYTVKVSARQGNQSAEALTLVKCVAPEGTYKRPASAASNVKAASIFELLWGLDEFFAHYPQVIDPDPDTLLSLTGGFGTTETEETVRQTAQKYLELDPDDPERPDTGRGWWYGWSLGGFGGYAIFGFDHSVENSGDYDLFIQGNAFRGNEEPGIVWVSQDDNGNGKPDDTWYELAGSARNDASTIPRYAIKYYRPKFPGIPKSEDNTGQTGIALKRYFPYWIDCEYVIYHGTKTTVPNSSTGYVDTMARPAFKISDAVQANGTPVHLDYIDFVKIQALSGTEFHTPEDLHIPNPEYLVQGKPNGNGAYTYQFVNSSSYDVDIAIGGQEYRIPVTVTLPDSSAYFEIVNAGNNYFVKEQGKVTFYMN